MKNYQKQKEKIVADFYKMLQSARDLISGVSKNNKIELKNNGVTFVMIDPFGDDCELSDVLNVENGQIELENGTLANVSDVTNLTDLIGLIECIDE